MLKVVVKRNQVNKGREGSFTEEKSCGLAQELAAAGTFHQRAGCLQKRHVPDKEQLDVAEAFTVALFFRRVQVIHPTHPNTDTTFAQNLPRNW